MTTKTFPAQFEYLDAMRDFAAEAARLANLDDKEISRKSARLMIIFYFYFYIILILILISSRLFTFF